MIILSDENLGKLYVFNLTVFKLLLPPTVKLSNKTKKPTLVITKCSVLMTVRWTVHEVHIYSIQQQKKWTNRKKNMISSFFVNSISRIIQEYFQAKIGRKMRLFSLARKNNILIYKKECISTWWNRHHTAKHYYNNRPSVYHIKSNFNTIKRSCS